MKEKFIAYGIILLALIGAAFVIRQSLPGDTVYVIKTEFMERSVGLLHFSIKNHTRYQWQNMDNRLHEAVVLHRAGNKDPKVQENISMLIEKSAERVIQGMKEQSGSDDEEVADLTVRIVAALGAYASLLRTEVPSSTMAVIDRSITNVRKAGEKSIHAIVTNQKGIESEPIALEAMRSARAAMDGIDLPSDHSFDLKYSTAKDALRDAESMLKEKKFNTAFELSNRAKGLATEIEVTLRKR